MVAVVCDLRKRVAQCVGSKEEVALVICYTVIHQEWAGSHGGLERLRERRADQSPPVLFGPRRDPRHSGQVLRSRGGSARPLALRAPLLFVTQVRNWERL